MLACLCFSDRYMTEDRTEMSKEKFRYSMIYDDIKEGIQSGAYPVGSLLPTEQTLASQYDVNRSTLRKAMQMLADEGLIEKCAGKGTVVLSSSATAPESAQVTTNKNIGFFLPKGNIITEPFYASLFNLLERDFQSNGCSLIYTTLDESDSIADKIVALGISGIVFVSNVAQKHMEYAVSHKIPAVLVNSVSDQLPSILSDNRRGAYLAGRYLIEQGHTDVALLAGIRSYVSNQARMAGVLQAFREEGIEIPANRILESDSWLYGAAESICYDYFSTHRDDHPTALFAFNDRLATGAINAIKKVGLSVPEEVSVIGYDNLGYYNLVSPRITSIETHIEAIAESTVMHMLWQLSSGNCLPVKVLTPVEVAHGDTVRDLRS